jgi:trimeric autotransporter adhesin
MPASSLPLMDMDFDTDIQNFGVSVAGSELLGNRNLTSNSLVIDAYNETLTISTSPAMTETNLENKVINIVLTDDWFVDNQISVSNITLSNAPAGLTIKSVTWTDSQHASLILAFDGQDFDSDIQNFGVSVAGSELLGNRNLTSNSLIIDAYNETLTISTSPAMTETQLDNKVINLVLSEEWFVDNQISVSNITLNNAPAGLTIKSVTWADSQHASLSLAFDGTDFDQDISNFSITLDHLELTGFNNLLSNTLPISAVIESKIEVPHKHDFFKIYPNPNQGRLKIELKESLNGMYKLTLFGSDGTMIEKIRISGPGTLHEFDFSYLSKGVYFIILDDTNHFYSKSFIIN